MTTNSNMTPSDDNLLVRKLFAQPLEKYALSEPYYAEALFRAMLEIRENKNAWVPLSAIVGLLPQPRAYTLALLVKAERFQHLERQRGEKEWLFRLGKLCGQTLYRYLPDDPNKQAKAMIERIDIAIAIENGKARMPVY